MLKDTDCTELEPPILRLRSSHPQCYAPHADVTRAKCAYGRQALPKLRKELQSKNPLVVKQAVNTIADLVHNPESATEALRLRIPDRLADLLVSDESFIRERVAMIYTSIASQSGGGATLMKNPLIVCNLAKSLGDRQASTRLKVAEVIEMLARNWNVAEDLCIFGFVDLIIDRITYEKTDILRLYLEALMSLLERDIRIHAIEVGIMEKLVISLQRKDEEVLANCLGCLGILCTEPLGKQKSTDMDLLLAVQPFLEDDRRSIHTKAASVVVFATITTAGKLRALNLHMVGRLLELAADFQCRELQLLVFKALTNIAEVPNGRCMMLQSHTMFIEDVDTCEDDTTEGHKAILLETIRWRP